MISDETYDCAGCGGEVPIMEAVWWPEVRIGVMSAIAPNAKPYCCPDCREKNYPRKEPTMGMEKKLCRCGCSIVDGLCVRCLKPTPATAAETQGREGVKRWRKKPVVIDATRWWQNGDHPDDGPRDTEGKVVRYFRRPDVPADRLCQKCHEHMHIHGWIDTLEGGHIVCRGDWIITGVKGERYPCKPDIFLQTYEPESYPVPAQPARCDGRGKIRVHVNEDGAVFSPWPCNGCPACKPAQPAAPAGQLAPPAQTSPAQVMDAALGLLAGNVALKGFHVALACWPKGLPQQPAIASTGEPIETGTAMARCCELIGQSLQQKPPEPKLVIATPSDTAALIAQSGKAFKQPTKRRS